MSDPFEGPRPRRLSGSSWRSCSLPSDLLPWIQPSEKKEMMDGIFAWTLFCPLLSVWIIAAPSAAMKFLLTNLDKHVCACIKQQWFIYYYIWNATTGISCKWKTCLQAWKAKVKWKVVLNPKVVLLQFVKDLPVNVDRCFGLSEKIRVKPNMLSSLPSTRAHIIESYAQTASRWKIAFGKQKPRHSNRQIVYYSCWFLQKKNSLLHEIPTRPWQIWAAHKVWWLLRSKFLLKFTNHVSTCLF